MFERSRGRKRNREESGMDSTRQLLLDLLRIGDTGANKNTQQNEEAAPVVVNMEQQIEDIVKELKQWLNLGDRDTVQLMLLDCVCEVSTKTCVYAAMIGLLNLEDRSFISGFLERCIDMFHEGMQQCQFNFCRILIRFFGCLMLVNVLQPSDITSLFMTIIKGALIPLESGYSSPTVEDDYRDPHLWQIWSDEKVYWVLSALPWIGDQLSNFAPTELDALFELISKYVEARPLKESTALRPFYGSKGEGDLAAKSDSGGFSFLPELFEAVQELKQAGWKTESIQFVHQFFEAKLGQAEPHNLAELQIGNNCPGIPANLSIEQKSALVREKIPPRGGIKLLPSARMTDKLRIERIIVEEYILDIVRTFESDKLECARQLTQNIPVTFPIGAILTETIVSQMMRLPNAAFKPVMYQALMLYFVQLGQQEFPKHIGGCVRELYNRLNILDAELKSRFVSWLAYHLSNFGFFWPWTKWEKVLTQPKSNPQRQFCQSVLRKLVQLSYFERVKKSLEDGEHSAFSELLPVTPEIFQISPWGENNTNGSDVDVEANNNNWNQIRETLRDFLANKKPPSEIKQWVLDSDIGTQLGIGNEGVLKFVLWVILMHGSKSYTHTGVMLERYKDLISFLIEQQGGEQGELIAVETVFCAWRNVPKRVEMCLEQLMTTGVLSGEAIVQWVVNADDLRNPEDEVMLELSQALLSMAVSFASDACQQYSHELSVSMDELQYAQHVAEDASQFAAAVQARSEGDSFKEQEAAEKERQSLEKVMEIEKKVQIRRESLEIAVGRQNAVAAVMISQVVKMVYMACQAAEKDVSKDSREYMWKEYCFNLLKVLCRKFHIVLASLLPSLLERMIQDQVPQEIQDVVKEYIKI